MKPLWSAVAILIVLGAYGVARAQTQKADVNQADTTTQLLQEVRALRLAIERSTTSGTRAQLLLGRLQMQEARMAALGRQVQEARSKLLDIQRERANRTAEVKRLADDLDRLTPDLRREVETQIEIAKRSMKDLEQREQGFQADYDSLAQAFSADESRWVDFNQRLEDLERSLAVQKQ